MLVVCNEEVLKYFVEHCVGSIQLGDLGTFLEYYDIYIYFCMKNLINTHSLSIDDHFLLSRKEFIYVYIYIYIYIYIYVCISDISALFLFIFQKMQCSRNQKGVSSEISTFFCCSHVVCYRYGKLGDHVHIIFYSRATAYSCSQKYSLAEPFPVLHFLIRISEDDIQRWYIRWYKR